MMRLGRFFQIAALILIAAGAQPAYSAFWQWSKTAGSNATADPSINWAEGMSPSSVNDSARAMMARAAEYRDDISGLLIAAGTSTAYTVTTNQGLSSTPSDGQLLAIRPGAANAIGVTLQADGGTAYPIKFINSSLALEGIPAATLLAGNPYTLMFSVSNGAWELRDFYGNPYTIPLGGILWSTAPTAPNANFVAPSGQCISTTTYATYWVQQGSPASGICPGGQFAIIDMRGRVPVALDTLNASAAGRLTNAATGCGTAMTAVGATCANGTQSKTLVTLNLPAYTPTQASATWQGVFRNYTTPGVGAEHYFVNAASGDGAGGLGTSLTVTMNAQGGASQPLPSVDPNIGLIPYLRIL